MKRFLRTVLWWVVRLIDIVLTRCYTPLEIAELEDLADTKDEYGKRKNRVHRPYVPRCEEALASRPYDL